MSGSNVVCLNGDVRLVGSNSSSEGRVEVCYNGSYYSTCDDFWDELDAQVVCRQLGYSTLPGTYVTLLCDMQVNP